MDLICLVGRGPSCQCQLSSSERGPRPPRPAGGAARVGVAAGRVQLAARLELASQQA